MFEVPASAAIAGLQAVVVAALFLTLGYLISDALLGRRVDAVTHWGLAFAGVGLFALVLILAHIATSGSVFGQVWPTRVATAALFLLLSTRKLLSLRSAGRRWRPRTDGWVALVLVIVAWFVWCSPVMRSMPLDVGGDVALHAGWSSQLLNGETTPSATITGEIPNFYPWLSHSIMAMLARILPEGRTYHAMAPLQLLQVAGIVLALFALGRALTRRLSTGVAASLFGGLTGGFGFFALRKLDVVLNPRAEDAFRYFGDLFHHRSYNAAFGQMTPAFPRDIALTLTVAFLLLVMVGLRTKSKPLLAASGVTLGMAGLTGAESFYVGLGVAVFVCLVPNEMARWKRAVTVVVPALAVAALWFGPQVATMLRLSYQNLTVVTPVNYPPTAIVMSLGVTTPFALWGAVRWRSRALSDTGALVVLAWTVVSCGAVLASSALPALLGESFEAIGRSHRYWPLVSLGLALFAALGATELLDALANRRGVALAASALTVALALPSPIVASLALSEARSGKGLLKVALQGKDSFLNLIAPRPGGRCVIAGPTGSNIDGLTWSYTGYRNVFLTTSNARPGNPGRLRWDRMYRATTPIRKRRRDNAILTRGLFDSERWRAIADEYGVDVVVARYSALGSPGFAGLEPDYPVDVPLAVFRLTDCGT
ncbi:MAG: hypothetical protein GEU68_05265 [Actinobacteria bacterium]|nr:hypothetical protein [Actinomycetota bacterium]